MKELIKEQVLKCVGDFKGGASFSDIDYYLENAEIPFKGDKMYKVPNNPSIFLWKGMSEEYLTALEELILDNKIVPVVVSEETIILVNGFRKSKIYRPIAKKLKHHYETMHWLPVVFKFQDGK